MCIYTLQYKRKLNVLKPASISATVALTINTTKHNSNDRNIGLENPNLQKSSQDSFDIETLGLCIYVDISPIKMYFSEAQVRIIKSVI